MSSVKLVNGDCLEVLRRMPDASVHAVVCDPPYGLSNTDPAHVVETLTRWAAGERDYVPGLRRDSPQDALVKALKALRPLAVGNADHSDPEPGQERVTFRVAVSSRLAAMLGTVDLDGDAERGQEEVESDGPVRQIDDLLGHDRDAEPGERARRYLLRRNATAGDTRAVTRQGKRALLGVDVRLGAHSLRQTEGAAEVVARAGAVVPTVLALDPARRTGELDLADGAGEVQSAFRLLGTEAVGASAGAGGLATVREAGDFGSVDDVADGALTVDVLVDLPVSWHASQSSTLTGFMGMKWDAFVPPPAVWDECLRVLKPGGHLLAFAGSRTFDLMTLSIRFAGFDIRDGIAWLYGSGFPKSLDVSKAIDKAAGTERARRLVPTRAGNAIRRGEGEQGATYGDAHGGFRDESEPATDDARTWQGWGTALKPGFEPVVVARKPLVGTVAANVLAHGTGALNIDATRVATDENTARKPAVVGNTAAGFGKGMAMGGNGSDLGRWPANVILDERAAAALDEQGRYFPTFKYQAKAPTRERPSYNREDGTRVAHATVKPVTLMRWLVRLVTTPGGTVLDPFAGSGATVEAAILEGFDVVGVEREAEYMPLIEQRVERAKR